MEAQWLRGRMLRAKLRAKRLGSPIIDKKVREKGNGAIPTTQHGQVRVYVWKTSV